jgi:hypothetical protein
MTDKRKYNRFDIRVPAVIEFTLHEEENNVKDCQTINLSAGGAFVHSLQPLEEGTPVRIELLLQFQELETPTNPHGDLKIAAAGVVLRTGHEGIAIRFNENYEIALGEVLNK